MGKIVDSIPLGSLLVMSIAMGLAPFVPMPHLAEKTLMLLNGELSRPIDIFDLFFHGTPALLLAVKLFRLRFVGAAAST